MREDRTPVLVGAGQYTQRDVELAEARSPLELMVECARRAAADAGIGAEALARLDSVAVVNILSWPYANAPGLLAEAVGAGGAEHLYTSVGGNSPLWLLNRACDAIAAGERSFVLLAGVEVVNTLRRAGKRGVPLPWSSGGTGTPVVVGDDRPGTNETETAHGLQAPVQIYPLFENALRAARGLSIDAHRARLGKLCSRFSAVAAENPYAWFRRARSAEEIATVTADNRYIGFPYTKYMNAIMDVDQSAAVLLASAAKARALGIPESRWIYPWAGADAHDHWFVSERVDYHSSPAIRIAGERALAMAGLGIEQIDCFDLYSCFPCAVEIAREMLGIAEDDPRPLTLTGGLAYHGGPGNNYAMHAIAAALAALRRSAEKKALVTALGWYITKHSIGIYAAEPPPRPWHRAHAGEDQARIDAMAHPPLAARPSGAASVETYTVMHDRDGRPAVGFVIGRLGDGSRFVARLPEDRSLLESFTRSEGVGRRGKVRPDGPVNLFDPR